MYFFMIYLEIPSIKGAIMSIYVMLEFSMLLISILSTYSHVVSSIDSTIFLTYSEKMVVSGLAIVNQASH